MATTKEDGPLLKVTEEEEAAGDGLDDSDFDDIINDDDEAADFIDSYGSMYSDDPDSWTEGMDSEWGSGDDDGAISLATGKESLSGGINGSAYRGRQSFTKSGKKCAKWSHTVSHTNKIFPDSGLNSNFCRNPDTSKTIWCYVAHN